MSLKRAATIVAAAGALSALAIPAMAETTFYGSARVATYWNTVDKPGAETNTDFTETLQGNSRFGMKASNGDLSGRFELGVGPSAVKLRLLYGSYKFNFGSVLVGQDYNNYYVASEEVSYDDNTNDGYGSLKDDRLPQIKVTLNNGLYFSAIQPNTNGNESTTRNYLPKLNVGYEGKAGNLSYGFGAVGQTFNQTKGTTPTTGTIPVGSINTNKDVTAFMGYVHGKLTSGPVALLVNFGAGQNMGNMGFKSISHANSYYLDKNTTNIEAMVQGSYTASEMLKLNVGVGYAVDDNSNYQHKDDFLGVFVNTPITIAKGFTVVPEFNYRDNLNEAFGATKGEKDYRVGAKWQMDF